MIPFGWTSRRRAGARGRSSRIAAIVAGSMFDSVPLDGDSDYSLVLLMPAGCSRWTRPQGG